MLARWIPCAHRLFYPVTGAGWPSPCPPEASGEYAVEVIDGRGRGLGTPLILSVNSGAATVDDGRASASLAFVGRNRVSPAVEKWRFTIVNQSNGRLDSLRLLVRGGEGCYLSDKELHLTPLPAGASLEYELPVRHLVGAGADCQPVIQLVNRAGHELAIASPDLAVPTRTAPAAAPDQITAPIITWLDPNPDLLERPEVVSDLAEMSVQLKIVSATDAPRGDFEMFQNGSSLRRGQKLDEVSFSGTGRRLTVTHKIRLEEGANELYATVKYAGGRAATDTLRVIYTPARPNLHLVSIGVPAYDLDYTTEGRPGRGPDVHAGGRTPARRPSGTFS